MKFDILSRVSETLRRLRWLILGVALLYVASVMTGLATGHLAPHTLHSFLAESDRNQAAQVEKVFGRFREPVRAGQAGAMVTCSALVLTLNLIGNLSNTLTSILILPIPLTLVLGGWCQGMGLSQLHPSSFLSGFLFMLMGALEWITYPVATAAGLNVALSTLFPQWQAVASRWLAFKRACRDAACLYTLVALLLAIQAVCEILYVRKVLLMGGTAVPLAPY